MTVTNMAATHEGHATAGTESANGSDGPRGKRIVLTTYGSFGDLHPYMALALELKARGHRPALATGNYYREKVEAAGIEFHPVRPDMPSEEEVPEIVARVMDVKKGGEFLIKDLLMADIRGSYEDLSQAVQRADLLLTHIVTFAGPIVAQKTGITWASSVLAPSSFFSSYEPFVLPQAPGIYHLLKLHPSIARAFMRLVKRQTQSWVENAFKLRSELGLSRGDHPLFEGQHSPERVLGMFPAVLGRPQPDWPPRTIVTGAAFYDRKDQSGMPEAIERFLAAGPAPIVFTLGSAAVFAPGDFYRQSIAVAQRLRRRAILLVGELSELLTEKLPEGIAAFDYAPYSELMPRAAAIVHQGGVGTTAQALRAGVPMLVVPFNHDQPDNAMRINHLGVSRTLSLKKYRAERVAQELEELLSNPNYASRAAEVGRMVREENGAAAAADALEEMLESKRSK